MPTAGSKATEGAPPKPKAGGVAAGPMTASTQQDVITMIQPFLKENENMKSGLERILGEYKTYNVAAGFAKGSGAGVGDEGKGEQKGKRK